MQELISSINWAIIAPFIIIQGILLLVAIIDWAKAAQTEKPRWGWFFVIVFLNIIGPILYFIFGRSRD